MTVSLSASRGCSSSSSVRSDITTSVSAESISILSWISVMVRWSEVKELGVRVWIGAGIGMEMMVVGLAFHARRTSMIDEEKDTMSIGWAFWI